ncbi:MAG: hypothetical protein AAF221_14305 [Pseudomonadota bacterium]
MTSAAAFAGLGWAATGVYILAQGYVSWQQAYDERLYYKLNAIGAAGLTVSSAAIASWQSVAVNIFWLVISITSLLKTQTQRQLTMSRWWVMAPLLAFSASALVWIEADRAVTYAVLGWSGSLLYCASYALFTFHVIRRVRFLAYNCVAAVLLLPVYALQANWPAFALSIVWALISASGCLAATNRRDKNQPE